MIGMYQTHILTAGTMKELALKRLQDDFTNIIKALDKKRQELEQHIQEMYNRYEEQIKIAMADVKNIQELNQKLIVATLAKETVDGYFLQDCLQFCKKYYAAYEDFKERHLNEALNSAKPPQITGTITQYDCLVTTINRVQLIHADGHGLLAASKADVNLFAHKYLAPDGASQHREGEGEGEGETETREVPLLSDISLNNDNEPISDLAGDNSLLNKLI